MTRKLHLLALALLATAALAAGCGGDDDSDTNADTPPAAQTDTGGAAAEPPAEEGAAPEITEELITTIVESVNENPAQICDPNNATAEFLETLGGEEECTARAEQEPTGEPYELTDVTIDGDTATATIEDDEGIDTVTFVTEGDQIKVASVEQE